MELRVRARLRFRWLPTSPNAYHFSADLGCLDTCSFCALWQACEAELLCCHDNSSVVSMTTPSSARWSFYYQFDYHSCNYHVCLCP